MRRPTLGQFFAVSAAIVAAGVSISFLRLEQRARTSVTRTARERQGQTAVRVEGRVQRELGRAQRVVENTERAIRAGAIDVTDDADDATAKDAAHDTTSDATADSASEATSDASSDATGSAAS